nr:unnamed protein product [Callosobruchus chinensis]
MIDFSCAFDTINYNLLLSILQYISLDHHSINFFQGYLGCRQQKVFVEENYSCVLDLRSGVPQGTILGPLLFAVYTSKLSKGLSTCKIHCYADDTQLYHSFPSSDVNTARIGINGNYRY